MAKDFITKEENYSQWYNDLVIKADLAENSAVRGCMIIKTIRLCNLGKDTGSS